MATTYTTTLDLNNILKMKINVPSREIGEIPKKEDVGTGDNSATIFYLDQTHIIANTTILYYGVDESSATNNLIETTDYSIELETAKITLTAAGVTKLGTNSIFAEYSYNSMQFEDEYLNDVICRAKDEADSILNTTFTDGTATNPSYPTTQLISPSQGVYNRNYFTDELPLIDVSSTLASDITDSDTSLTLATGDGVKFPTSGKILIGTEIIAYTGISTDTLTGLTRGQDSSDAAAHSTNDEIHTTIVEVSESLDGATPVFSTLEWGKEFYADENGNVFIHEETRLDNIPQDIPNRIKIRHYHGYDSIPKDIERLNLLIAKRNLVQDNIGKALVEGRNEFKPEMFNVDINEINRIVDAWRINAMKNT